MRMRVVPSIEAVYSQAPRPWKDVKVMPTTDLRNPHGICPKPLVVLTRKKGSRLSLLPIDRCCIIKHPATSNVSINRERGIAA